MAGDRKLSGFVAGDAHAPTLKHGDGLELGMRIVAHPPSPVNLLQYLLDSR